MDVERLMRDLSVEQLRNIQTNLQTEMEAKREELREMVGRRYRDVLEAASEVRRVRSLADSLATAVGSARHTQNSSDSRSLVRGDHATMQRFIALHRLLPIIGNEEGDALSDAFALLLAENIHKQISTENTSQLMHGVVSGLSGRLLRTRKDTIASISEELGELSDPNWVAAQLAALALLQHNDLDQLLDTYLQARIKYMEDLVRDSATVLQTITEIKATLTVVEQLFVHGKLVRVLHAVAAPSYRPALVNEIIGDQAFTFAKMMDVEIERVNRDQRERKIGQLLTQRINDKAVNWVDKVCDLAHGSVANVCEFLEKTDDVIEFLHAISGVLRENWPRLTANTTLYQKLFHAVVIDKFRSLLSRDMSLLEEALMGGLGQINTCPHPLFEKRPGRFDPLLGVGISGALRERTKPNTKNVTERNDLTYLGRILNSSNGVGKGTCSALTLFLEGVGRVSEACGQYEKVAMDADAALVRDALAENLANIIQRLSSMDAPCSDRKGADLGGFWTTRARLCLALLHCQPTTICQALNKDGDRITASNKALHASIELSLSNVVCEMVRDCLSESCLNELTAICARPLDGLRIATEWEKVRLEEVGEVEIPVCVSAPLLSSISRLSSQLGESALAHIASRNIRKALSAKVSETVYDAYSAALASGHALQRTLIQLLFDLRVLNLLFPHEKLKSLISTVENRVDPFDLSLLSPLLNTNVRLAAQRIQLLVACLVVDVLPSKDAPLASTFTQVVDIVPRPEHPLRISLIPRLDRQPTDDVSKRLANSKAPRNKLLANPTHPGSKGTPSLSTFYDKISSSFFGSN